MKVLLIILGVLFLIGCIPVGVRFAYDGQVSLHLILAFLRLQLVPKKELSPKKKAKAAKKKAKKAEAKARKKAEAKKKKQAQSLIAQPPAPPKPKKPLTDQLAGLLPWAKLGASFVGEFVHRKLTVKVFRLRVRLAGSDPAKVAETVGTAWEVIGITNPVLDRAFRVKRRDIVVYPDFLADKTDLMAELDIRLRIGGVVLIAFKYGFKAVKLLLAQKKAAKQAKKKQQAAAARDGSPMENAKLKMEN